MEGSAITRVAPTVALVGVCTFGVLIAALHVVRPELNPLVHPTSQYAVGSFGYVMSVAFIAMSVASFALTIGLSRQEVAPERALAGRILLGLWGVGALIAMLFPLNELGTEPTLASKVHRINGPIGFLSITLGAILLSRRFGHDRRWQSIARPAQFLSWAMLAFFFVTGAAIATRSGFGGLSQRVQLVLLVAWFVLTARRAHALVDREARHGDA